MSLEKTKINDRNIHSLVRTYFDNKNALPKDLQNIQIGDWDVINVTDMEGLFKNQEEFNEPLNNWNVSNVINMKGMFEECIEFNQPLEKWNVSKVVNMKFMFIGCSMFDQDLSAWIVDNVTDMERMFCYCKLFNQPLNTWNVNNVKTMEGMFEECESFNQPLYKWNVSNVLQFEYMFLNCKKFNQSLNEWDFSKRDTSIEVTIFSMFEECESFNQPLNNWNVSNIRNMSNMFRGCIVFNQPLDNWNVENVIVMSNMFENCVEFNQPLHNWDVATVEDAESIFLNCPIEEQNKPHFAERVDNQEDDPYEIHKAAAKVNYSKLIELFNTKMDIKMPENINYANYINESLLKIIDETDDSEIIKTQQKNGLNRIMTERLQGILYTEFSPLLLKTIFYTLQYVSIQPTEFQKIYVDTFIKECIHAYRGPDGMTCVGGALERIVISLTNACQTMLSSGDNEDYSKIVAILVAYPDKLIPEYIQDWYKLHKTGTPNAFNPFNNNDDVENLDKKRKERKENLKLYLLEKFPEEEELIGSKIAEIADNIGYDDDNFMYGGRKRKHKHVSKTMKRGKSQKGTKTMKRGKSQKGTKTKKGGKSQKGNKTKKNKNEK